MELQGWFDQAAEQPASKAAARLPAPRECWA